MSAGGTSEATENNQHANQWEEVGEAMNKTSIWQRGNDAKTSGGRGEIDTVYSAGGEGLTTTEGIVSWWKKYFEDLFNFTKHCMEEAEQ